MITSRLIGVACLAIFLGAGQSAADELSISEQAVADMIVETGVLSADRFATINDRYVGTLLVGGAGQSADESEAGTGISVVIYPGDDGGTEQIQFILKPPWGDLGPRIEAMATVVAEIAGQTPEGPTFSAEEDPVRAAMTPAAQWLYGIMMESWIGWPGSPQRVVRVIGDVAIIIEGVPPDIWGVTIVPDAGYTDWTWPGISPDTDSAEVAEARLAIRRGDYAGAMSLLETAVERDEAAAGALLGDMYRFARLDLADHTIAADWYLVAGRHRYAPGVYNLAMMSDEGWGVLFMTGQRLPLVEKAADAGSPDAIYILSGQENGVFYVRPEGVTAADQVRQAATMGLLAAQQDLADRYAAGNGVEPDPLLAYAWALVALDNTDPGLDYIRSHQLAADLRDGLSDAEIAEAKRLAEELVAGEG